MCCLLHALDQSYYTISQCTCRYEYEARLLVLYRLLKKYPFRLSPAGYGVVRASTSFSQSRTPLQPDSYNLDRLERRPTDYLGLRSRITVGACRGPVCKCSATGVSADAAVRDRNWERRYAGSKGCLLAVESSAWIQGGTYRITPARDGSGTYGSRSPPHRNGTVSAAARRACVAPSSAWRIITGRSTQGSRYESEWKPSATSESRATTTGRRTWKDFIGAARVSTGCGGRSIERSD
jgi:hypothetical protein